MFTAINAEMRRRQALNADTGTKDIVEYRQKGLHLTRRALPAPLHHHRRVRRDDQRQPRFGEELDSITRVGRAQGVNLLLASQRPTGVSDQMRANIKLRICPARGGRRYQPRDAAPARRGLPAQRHARARLPSGRQRAGRADAGGLYRRDLRRIAEAAEGGEKPKFYDVIVKLANDLLNGRRARSRPGRRSCPRPYICRPAARALPGPRPTRR